MLPSSEDLRMFFYVFQDYDRKNLTTHLFSFEALQWTLCVFFSKQYHIDAYTTWNYEFTLRIIHQRRSPWQTNCIFMCADLWWRPFASTLVILWRVLPREGSMKSWCTSPCKSLIHSHYIHLSCIWVIIVIVWTELVFWRMTTAVGVSPRPDHWDMALSECQVAPGQWTIRPLKYFKYTVTQLQYMKTTIILSVTGCWY